MNKQQGAAALLVVSVLLVAALIMSLGSYKSLFYQIKRANNQIEARQEHWRAEGGLECFYSLVQHSTSPSAAVPLIASQCETPLNLHQLSIVSPERVISQTSETGSRVVEKQLVSSRARASGALKSSSDLYIVAGSTFSTPDPGKFKGAGWECVAIRYRNGFFARGSTSNKGVVHGSAPYNGFDNQGKDCLATNKTVTNLPSGYREDFVQDSNLDPFFDTFRESRSDWNAVKTSWNFTAIDFNDTANRIVTDCGKKVADEIKAGKTRIWVTGSCEFSSITVDNDGNTITSGIEHLNNAFDATGDKPVLLVVHDGIFAVHGSLTFPGMLYQLTTNSLSGLEAHWNLFEAKDHFGEAAHFPTLDLDNVVYLQRGSFSFSGGQVLDSPGYSAYFVNSLDFAYNRDNLDEVIDPILKYRWKKGSWNDL